MLCAYEQKSAFKDGGEDLGWDEVQFASLYGGQRLWRFWVFPQTAGSFFPIGF